MIPKIIHQLWIGDKSKKPQRIMDMWRDMNPEYTYYCWDEELIEEKLKVNKRYKFKIENHEAIWGKADMYRWLILKEYGGIFIDADIIPIEPLDDELIMRPFVCYEQEEERAGLLATSVQAYPPNHILPNTSIEWIMNNNVNETRTKTASWILVGPGLLTRSYETLKQKGIENCIDIKPSYTFLPDHHTGKRYLGHGKVYATHEWGSTRNNYKQFSKMLLPDHFKQPSHKNNISIDLTNINLKHFDNCLNSIKNMEGRYNILLHYNNDDDNRKYLLNWVKKTRWITIYSTIKGEVSGTEV